MIKVKIDRVTIERDAVEVELPENCPECGVSFEDDEDSDDGMSLKETRLIASDQMCAIVDGEVSNHDSYEDFAEGSPAVAYACVCGHVLANEEHIKGPEACGAECGDACDGSAESFLHHTNRVTSIMGALRVVRSTLGKREDSSDVEQALALLEHFLHVSDIPA